MDNTKFSETILLSLEAFWVLQELESMPPTSSASEALNEIYFQRAVTYEEVKPLLRMGTCLCLLTPALAFASALADKSQLEEFSIRDEHTIQFSFHDTPKTPDTKEVLRTIRNSLSHFTEPFADNNNSTIDIKGRISFPKNAALKLNNKNTAELVFGTREGFISFLNDLLPIVKSKLKSGNDDYCIRSEDVEGD
jgi:hypothetical protein